MFYKDLPKGTKLVDYNQLSNDAKLNAINQVINIDLKYYNNRLTEYKTIGKTNIHQVINNPKLKSLIKNKKHIIKLINDVKYTENYIIGNLCNFTEEGIYITYNIQ